MPHLHPAARIAFLATVVLTCAPHGARADVITANCTGMMDLNIYTFDTALPEQEVAGIGTGSFRIDDDAIVMTGTFGEYRFDRKVGTLYQDGRDTGLYCTYSIETR